MFGGLIASCFLSVFLCLCESLNFELVMLVHVITPHYCSDMSMFRVKKGCSAMMSLFESNLIYQSTIVSKQTNIFTIL